jgi:hypothetical protein
MIVEKWRWWFVPAGAKLVLASSRPKKVSFVLEAECGRALGLPKSIGNGKVDSTRIYYVCPIYPLCYGITEPFDYNPGLSFDF